MQEMHKRLFGERLFQFECQSSGCKLNGGLAVDLLLGDHFGSLQGRAEVEVFDVPCVDISLDLLFFSTQQGAAKAAVADEVHVLLDVDQAAEALQLAGSFLGEVTGKHGRHRRISEVLQVVAARHIDELIEVDGVVLHLQMIVEQIALI